MSALDTDRIEWLEQRLHATGGCLAIQHDTFAGFLLVEFSSHRLEVVGSVKLEPHRTLREAFDDAMAGR